MTGVQDVDWLAIGPVLGPAVAALAVLVLDAVIGSARTGARMVTPGGGVGAGMGVRTAC